MLRFASLLFLFIGGHPVAPPTLPGERVVRDAYRMYDGKWFKTVFFAQRTEVSADPTLGTEPRVETWYVAVQPPGLTRIDVAPAITGRALIYRGDSTYEYGKGLLRGAHPGGREPLFILLHDLHSARPEKTIATLRRYGFDFSRTHERTWDGEKVIVVGALAGDTVSNQFWLEKRRMILVRLLERNGADPRRPLDARVTGYERAGHGWLEHSIRLFLGGRLSMVEDYTNIHIDAPPEAGLFDPVPYHLPRWLGAGKDLFGGLPNTMGGH